MTVVYICYKTFEIISSASHRANDNENAITFYCVWWHTTAKHTPHTISDSLPVISLDFFYKHVILTGHIVLSCIFSATKTKTTLDSNVLHLLFFLLFYVGFISLWSSFTVFLFLPIWMCACACVGLIYIYTNIKRNHNKEKMNIWRRDNKLLTVTVV